MKLRVLKPLFNFKIGTEFEREEIDSITKYLIDEGVLEEVTQERLEDKIFNHDGHSNGCTNCCKLSAQVAKEHYLAVFDKYVLNTPVSTTKLIRKILEDA